MLMLALDASAKAASAALARDGVLLGQYFQNCGLTHSATLLPMAEALLKNCGLSVSDVDVFAATKGPGSFTGVRIGVSTVKALAHAGGKPCIGVDALEDECRSARRLNLICVVDVPRTVTGNVCLIGNAHRRKRGGELFLRIIAAAHGIIISYPSI